MNLRQFIVKFQHGVHNLISMAGYGLANFRTVNRSEDFKIVRRFIYSYKILMTPVEAYQLFSLGRSVRKLDGDVAELGVAYGGSAMLLSEICPDKTIHLFDTFQGLPTPGKSDPLFKQGEFSSSLPYVKSVLRGKKCIFYPGYFPETASPVAGSVFSLVHLDADLYQSTLDGLAFFYPRMVAGGCIIGHDYALAKGVRDAFDEFFSDKLEPVVELSGNQCVVVKVEIKQTTGTSGTPCH